jgi:hypothetical protein
MSKSKGITIIRKITIMKMDGRPLSTNSELTILVVLSTVPLVVGGGLAEIPEEMFCNAFVLLFNALVNEIVPLDDAPVALVNAFAV